MSTRNPFEEEITALKALRDELRVQLNLATKEIRDSYEAAEGKWNQLHQRIEQLRDDAREPTHEIQEGLKHLARELRDAYHDIRDRL